MTSVWRVTGKLTKVSPINLRPLPPTFYAAILRQKYMTLHSGLSVTYCLIRFYFLDSKPLWEGVIQCWFRKTDFSGNLIQSTWWALVTWQSLSLQEKNTTKCFAHVATSWTGFIPTLPESGCPKTARILVWWTQWCLFLGQSSVVMWEGFGRGGKGNTGVHFMLSRRWTVVVPVVVWYLCYGFAVFRRTVYQLLTARWTVDIVKGSPRKQ